MKRYNILHIVLSLGVGGLERMVFQLFEKTDSTLFNTYLVCLNEKGELGEQLGASGRTIEVINKPNRLSAGCCLKLAKFIRKHNIALIHTHNTGPYLYGVVAAWLSGFPRIVHTEHGRVFPDKKRLMFAEKLLSLSTYQIVAVSEDLKNSLIKFEKISENKITVLPNGINLDIFKPLGVDVIRKKKKEVGIREDAFVVGHIGRLVAVKNQGNLLEAFANAQIPDAQLVLVGDGPRRTELSFFVKKLGIENRVIFLGERYDLSELLNTFDVFALSSDFEGVPLTLLEAMAVKKPIISTAVGGVPDIIQNGMDGLLVPPGEPVLFARALELVYKQPDRFCQYAERAYSKIINRYDINFITNQYEKLYLSALQ